MLAGVQHFIQLSCQSAIVVSCLGYCAGEDIERLIVERYIYTDEEYKASMTQSCPCTSSMTGMLCDVAMLVRFVTKSERRMCSSSDEIDEEKSPVYLESALLLARWRAVRY